MHQGTTDQQLRYWIGQKLMIDIRQTCSPAQRCEDLTQLPASYAAKIRQLQLGGVILFANNLKHSAQIRQLTQDLHQSSGDGLPLLIGIDQEGGRVARLPVTEYPAFAGAMALGATQAHYGEQFPHQVATAMAHQLHELGINLNFAPSLDVNNNRANPVINVRSFGDQPAKVAAAGAAMVNAMQQQGVLATIKHFPGHGDTHVDSHTGLPRVDHPLQVVQQTDLAPFAAVLQHSQPAMVMTAHIQYPALDNSTLVNKQGDNMLKPATLSRRMLTELLRQHMGYQGVIITDALNMAGISQFFEPAEAVIQTFAAGADIALMPYEIRSEQDLTGLQQLIDAVLDAVVQGRLSVTELQQSAERVLSLRRKLAHQKAPATDPHRLSADRQLEQQLAEASLTQVGTNKLPAGWQLEGQRLLLIAPEQTKCQGWQQALTLHQVKLKQLNCATLDQSAAELQTLIDEADTILATLISPTQSAAELGVLADLLALTPVQLSPAEQKQKLLTALTYAKQQGKQNLLVALRTPYDLSDFADVADLRLATYSYNQQPLTAQRPLSGPAYDAVIACLLGKIQPKGQLPVQLD
ncbi:glycoside hydrolase family 3 protein [Rheinheimera sp.]|uniref:glycoside hydrolase family 3 protein n=1 Tax=Rheinheimera sp. TaxID=1869214 RepID=UPI00307FA3D2